MEEQNSFELGDRVYISGGVLDGLRGRVYYLNEDLLEILPEGEFHRVVKIPIVDGDFDPELQITAAYTLEKRASPAFVAQNDFQVEYLAETITEEGKFGTVYTIKEINEDEDSAVFTDETGADKKIVFGFIGIPRDEDFSVLRVREPPEVEKEAVAHSKEEVEQEEEDLTILGDVEIPDIQSFKEIPVTQQYYPDITQRNEMLQDLLSTYSIRQQKNPDKQSEVRKLVELMILLRNDIIRYSKSGEPMGQNSTTFSTLIDLLQGTHVPLARQVADAKRVVYLDHSVEGLKAIAKDQPSEDPTSTPFDSVVVQYLQDTIRAGNEFQDTQLSGIQSQVLNTDVLPNWFLGWEGYFQRHMASWVSGASENNLPFSTDTEFLRFPVPDLESASVEGLPPVGNEKDKIVGTDDLGYVTMSLLRGLGPRSGRLREKEPQRVIESAESVVAMNYLLFPLKYDADLGSVRSGKLAIDIGKSMMAPRTLLSILREQGGVSDVPSAGSIISLNGASIGNITIEDWLQGQPLGANGLGDILATLSSFGLSVRELSVDQMAVLIEKIDAYRALVRTTIVNYVEKAEKELSEIALQNNPLLEQVTVQEIITKLMGEPNFQKKILEFQNRFPSYRENDIALFATLFVYMYDFTFAALAGGPRSLQIEIRRSARKTYLRRVYESMMLMKKKLNAGMPPEPNPCPHVRSLDMVRKVKDSTQRLKLLNKFITDFGGEKKDNWLKCIVCSKQCLCNHEILLLQEFMKPREKEALHKELLLAFSGGQFHGGYMCKNCGQSISSVEYDTSLEYDDEGRPMMGRAVLVDNDAIEEDLVEQMLGTPAEAVVEIQFDTSLQKTIYKAARQILSLVGIQASLEGYKTIVRRVGAEMGKLQSREDYSKYQKAAKTKGLATQDYDILFNRILVVSVAAYSLIDIQTTIPGYVVRYKLPGYKASFAGAPMGSENERGGIEYISGAVASVMKAEAPWNMTGFQKEKSDAKRQATIAKLVGSMCLSALSNSEIQQDIAMKKEYLEKTYGKTTQDLGLVEKVPTGFFPQQWKRDDVKTNAVPEAASSQEKSRAWIVQAHGVARESALLMEGSPYAETSCCFHPIQSPLAFWSEKEKSLPSLTKKDIITGPRGSHLAVHYKARRLDITRAIPSDAILYRIFLKVCFQGDRKGLPHEPGYDNLCPHCGFTFPAEMNDELGKGALDAQKVVYTRDAFQELLDEAHRQYRVTPPISKRLVSGAGLFEKLIKIQTAPFAEWGATLSTIIAELNKLPENKPVEDIDLATIYGTLSNYAEEFTQELVGRLRLENRQILDKLVDQPPSALVESMRTYFLIPFQRLSTGFNTKNLQVQKSYDLPPGTEVDVNKNIAGHLEFMGDLVKRMKGITRGKIEYARTQLMEILPIIQQEIRTPLLPGGSIGLPYLLKTIVLGILAGCANPNFIPEGMDIVKGEAVDMEARGAMQIIAVCLSRFLSEGLNFSPEEIRSMIARRNEVEKTRIVSKFKTMTPEEKAVELMNKRLGLGDWSIGGTAAIYRLNETQYERERRERTEMGIVGVEEGGAAPGDEDGYAVDQTNADDY